MRVSKLNKSAAESLSAAARCVPIAGFASAAHVGRSRPAFLAQFSLIWGRIMWRLFCGFDGCISLELLNPAYICSTIQGAASQQVGGSCGVPMDSVVELWQVPVHSKCGHNFAQI
jgi:hypothetical protein